MFYPAAMREYIIYAGTLFPNSITLYILYLEKNSLRVIAAARRYSDDKIITPFMHYNIIIYTRAVYECMRVYALFASA